MGKIEKEDDNFLEKGMYETPVVVAHMDIVLIVMYANITVLMGQGTPFSLQPRES